jgi:hypothetical protein
MFRPWNNLIAVSGMARPFFAVRIISGFAKKRHRYLCDKMSEK